MGITRAQVTSVEALAAWMQTNMAPNIFKAVAYDNGVLTATDADDNVVLEIAGNAVGTPYFRAYRSSENYIGFNLRNFPNPGNSTIDIIGCDNGMILKCSVVDTQGYGRSFALLCAKTNNDKPAIVFPSPSSNDTAAVTASLNHVAFGDSATIATTTTFTPESGQQTIMCAFGTNADITDVSYTPKAFYMPIHSAYNQGIGKFLCGGKVYITNGYWCIDTEQTEEDAT